MPYIREDQADIRLWVDDTPFGESWLSADGANLAADSQKTRPGGMGREVSVGGPASRDDLTLTIQFSDITAGWVSQLEAKVGIGAAKIGISWLNPNRTPSGRSQTIRGTVKAVNKPAMGGGAAVGVLTVIIDCDELAT